jgi:polysaccharide export outer membrane protein
MVDLKNLLDGDPGLNVPIFPGDTVTIPLGGVVYVVGAVNKPGGFVLSTERHGMTVLQALALAEDAKPTAVRDKALIVRQTSQSNGARQEIPVKLGQIISGKATDVALQPNDILFVPDSAGRKALRRGAEAAIQLVTGVVVWGRY